MTEQPDARTLGDWSRIAIEQYYQKILKHEPKVLKNKDPEELHQMRVGMRRLRTALVGFSQAIILPKAVTEKKVGLIARILGELRDLDVLEETLTKIYAPELPNSEKQKLGKTLDSLEKRRKQAAQATKDILNKPLYKNLKTELEHWLAQPKYSAIAALPIESVLPDLLLPQVSNFLLHSGWLVGAYLEPQEGEFLSNTVLNKSLEMLSHAEEIKLHSLRKEAKRTRYLMELLSDFYGDNYHTILKKIKNLQEVLGEIQDSFVLRQLLADSYGHHLRQTMPTLTQHIREHRQQKGQDWEELRRFFLNPDTRIALRTSVQSPQSAILTATSH
ncbi:MAG: CHAD domain-containing protein [Snowella sp.]|nr:CHAD domain-containing protein [Snowella sp.]